MLIKCLKIQTICEQKKIESKYAVSADEIIILVRKFDTNVERGKAVLASNIFIPDE